MAASDHPVLPAGFCLGAATSAYPIEGAWDADGKGPSVWDTLAHRTGGFAGSATGDVACDHYRRMDEDLDLIADLGLTSYRFSVSWPRVQPDGKGRWNARGVDFYDRLVDGLVARGIEPTATLYHWDHPQALEDAGGWMRRSTAGRFADYAEGVVARLGDRVARWITLNEPQSVLVGNIAGFARPAGPLGAEGLAVAHNLLLAHGFALERLRQLSRSGEVGIALNVTGVEAGSDDPVDLAATERAHAIEDRLFLDPLLAGRYPPLGALEGHLGEVRGDDFNLIAAPVDFLGVNWYAPARVVDPEHRDTLTPAGDGPQSAFASLLGALPEIFGYTRTNWSDAPANLLGWPVVPKRLGVLLAWLDSTYPNLPPLYITENGLPLKDEMGADGAFHDEARIDYLRACLAQVAAATASGLDVRGYFVWSLMDNLEWAVGFEPRFGLIHVDFDSLERTPKDSYWWYRELIAAQSALVRSGSPPHALDQYSLSRRRQRPAGRLRRHRA